jgi:hypothetical protein
MNSFRRYSIAASAIGIALLTVVPIQAQTSPSATPFFQARGDRERCQALDVWTSKISSGVGGRSLDLVTMGQLARLAAPMFRDEVFRPAFGKSYRDLTKGDKNAIQKSLRSCFDEAWRRTGMAEPFYPQDGISAPPHWTRPLEQAGALTPALEDPKHARPPGRLPVVPDARQLGDRKFMARHEEEVERYCVGLRGLALTLRREYPNPSFRFRDRSPEYTRVLRMYASAFRDDLFIPIFGKAYDRLTPDEMGAIRSAAVEPCLSKHRGGIWGGGASLREMFSPQGSFFSFDRLSPQVTGGRQFRAQLAQMKLGMGELQAQPDGYYRVRDLRASFERDSDYLWPSEQGEYRKLLEEASTASADHLLRVRLRPLLARARDAAAVQKAAADYRDALADASRTTREEYQALIAAKVSQVAPAQPNSEREVVTGGTGYDFTFPASLGPRLALSDVRSADFNIGQAMRFRSDSEYPFPEIHARYKAARRSFFLMGGDVDAKAVWDEIDQKLGSQSVLLCTYVGPEGQRTVYFWHGTAPDAARPPRLKAVEGLHPLLMIGRPRESCPPDSQAAIKIVRENYKAGADFDTGKLADPDPVLLPENVAAMRAGWSHWMDAIAAAERYAAGLADGLPFPRRPSLVRLSGQQRAELTAKAHNFNASAWGRLAFSDPRAYLLALREYNRLLMGVMK